MRAWIAAIVVLGTALAARGQGMQGVFETAIGYSHLSLSGSDRFGERDGLRIEPRVSFNPFSNMPELRLGFGLGMSGYSHKLDTDSTVIIDNGHSVTIFKADQFEVLSLLEPEFQVSLHEKLGDGRWFVEPGLGIGAAIANYGITSNWWWDDVHDSQWDSTFAVRPFIRMGYRETGSGIGWSFGGEVSYMFGGDLHLTDQVHGDVSEFFAGGFLGFTW